MNAEDPKNRRAAPLHTPTNLSSNATRDLLLDEQAIRSLR
jgi:hypothetical protein